MLCLLISESYCYPWVNKVYSVLRWGLKARSVCLSSLWIFVFLHYLVIVLSLCLSAIIAVINTDKVNDRAGELSSKFSRGRVGIRVCVFFSYSYHRHWLLFLCLVSSFALSAFLLPPTSVTITLPRLWKSPSYGPQLLIFLEMWKSQRWTLSSSIPVWRSVQNGDVTADVGKVRQRQRDVPFH